MMIDPPLPILLICTVALSFAVALVMERRYPPRR